MHELGIAQSIIQTVLDEVAAKGLTPVESITVRVGALSSVVPEALEFGFDALKADTALAETQLKIERVPIQGKCKDCGRDFDVEDYVFACPHCESGQLTVLRGEELEIAYLEVAG